MLKKGILIGLGAGLIIGAVVAKGILFNNNYNCEFCGERFNNRVSAMHTMCDMCFGCVEERAKHTEKGIDYTFEDGEFYHFNGQEDIRNAQIQR